MTAPRIVQKNKSKTSSGLLARAEDAGFCFSVVPLSEPETAAARDTEDIDNLVL